MRVLELGDIAWVLRATLPETRETREHVVDCVMERKTIVDLEASLQDRRYHEQKFRLLRCGLKRLVYLVEGPLPASQGEGLMNELLETHLEGLLVHRTENLDDTMRYIFRSHCLLEEKLRAGYFLGIALSLQYPEFARSVMKNKNASLTDVFAKMLMRVRGCTPEKAAAITAVFPTLRSLTRRLEVDTMEATRTHLASLRAATGKKVGPALAQHIIVALCNEDPNALLMPSLTEEMASQES